MAALGQWMAALGLTHAGSQSSPLGSASQGLGEGSSSDPPLLSEESETPCIQSLPGLIESLGCWGM